MKANQTQVLNRERILSAALIFRAIGNKSRLEILGVIIEHKECNVNVIYKVLDIEQSICSQHLKTLRNAGVVNTRRDGKKIYYSISEERLAQINKAIDILKEEKPKKEKAK